MLEFFTLYGSQIGVIIVAIAGWIQNQRKNRRTEKATADTQEAVDAYKKTVGILEDHVADLQRKEDQQNRRHKWDITALNEKVNACEQAADLAQQESREETRRLQYKVRKLEDTNADLNANLAPLIQELKHLNDAVRVHGVKRVLETTNS
jgi:hypothetical protein